MRWTQFLGSQTAPPCQPVRPDSAPPANPPTPTFPAWRQLADRVWTDWPDPRKGPGLSSPATDTAHPTPTPLICLCLALQGCAGWAVLGGLIFSILLSPINSTPAQAPAPSLQAHGYGGRGRGWAGFPTLGLDSRLAEHPLALHPQPVLSPLSPNSSAAGGSDSVCLGCTQGLGSFGDCPHWLSYGPGPP